MRGTALACAIGLTGCVPSDATEDPDTDGSSSGVPGTTTVTSTTSTTSGGRQFDQTLGCMMWLDCLDPTARAALNPEYGPQGSCWTQNVSTVEMCDATCVQGLGNDCEPPDDDDSASDTTGPPVEECALDVLAPSARSWVEAGDDAEVIPTEIGAILEDNCSCHVAELESFDRLTPLYYGNVRFHTFAQMQSSFEGQPTYVEVGIRALDELNMPPVYFCGDAEFGSIHSPDYEILQAWIEAEAPDGAQWLEQRPEDLPTRDR